MSDDRTEKLRVIKDEVLALKSSPLYEERVKNKVFPVIGEGNHQAHIMFIGEAPGKNEAKTGRPFVGAAGKILDQMLESVGILRTDVYITNIVKDRPPLNRDPSPKEIAAYTPFLDKEIEIIRPKVIVTLGRFSMKYIMQKFNLDLKTIGTAHGKELSAQASYGAIDVIPLYHPSVATYGHARKKIVFEDFKILKKHI